MKIGMYRKLRLSLENIIWQNLFKIKFSIFRQLSSKTDLASMYVKNCFLKNKKNRYLNRVLVWRFEHVENPIIDILTFIIDKITKANLGFGPSFVGLDFFETVLERVYPNEHDSGY